MADAAVRSRTGKSKSLKGVIVSKRLVPLVILDGLPKRGVRGRPRVPGGTGP